MSPDQSVSGGDTRYYRDMGHSRRTSSCDMSVSTSGPNNAARGGRAIPRAGNSRAERAPRFACNTCRDRKVRCDRAWPSCSRCARLGDECLYRGRSDGDKAQSDVPLQLKQLQQRLAQAEARLSSQQYEAPQLEYITTTQHPALNGTVGPTSTEMPSLTPGDNMVHQDEAACWPSMSPREVSGMLNCSYGTQMDHQPTHMATEVFGLKHLELGWLNNPLGMAFFSDDVSLASSGEQPTSSHQNPPSSSPESSSSREQRLPFWLTSPGMPTASSATSVDLNATQISPKELLELFDSYFDIFYPTMPILSKDRFFALIENSHSAPQVQALSYAVALVGSMVSKNHTEVQATCLRLTRKYLELCDADEELPMVRSLDVFQATVLLIRYELTHRNIVHAWMTIGRAVRLANMLKLHVGSGQAGDSEFHHALPPVVDPVCIEEQRRTFWTLYICETYASSRARLRPQLHEEDISIPLPSPGLLDSNFQLSPTPTLAESYNTTNINDSHISSFAGIVLACAIVRRCQPHAEQVSLSNSSPSLPPSPSPKKIDRPAWNERPAGKGFWDNHFSLLTILKHRVELLAPHLTVRKVQTDPVAFALYIYLCGIDIAAQEVAVYHVQQQSISPLVAADSSKRSRAAACRLVGVARATQPGYKSRVSYKQCDYFKLHGALMARPIVTALEVLSRDLQDRPDDVSASMTADSIQLLLGVLDRMEEEGGFWHRAVVNVVQLVKEWEDTHGDRPADAWAAIMLNDS